MTELLLVNNVKQGVKFPDKRLPPIRRSIGLVAPSGAKRSGIIVHEAVLIRVQVASLLTALRFERFSYEPELDKQVIQNAGSRHRTFQPGPG